MPKKPHTDKDHEREMEFFNKLLLLCKEYKVNMQTDNLSFWDSKEKTNTEYAWIEVNGSWEIDPDFHALVAHRLESPAVESIHSIKGTKGIK